jgi:glucose-6-phosphate 1-dehydrogenase
MTDTTQSRDASDRQEITIVIFGATGDLAQTKLLPGIAQLMREKKDRFDIHCIGVGRRDLTDRSYMESFIQESEWVVFENHITYLQADISNTQELQRLPERLETLQRKESDILYYFATPTRFYKPVAQTLHTMGLTKHTHAFRRAIFEKPFGNSYKDAEQLFADIYSSFDEEQVFFIDHYLGKDTAQDIIASKLFNPLYGASLNYHSIESIELVLSEDETIGTRGQYYDSVGVIKDMIQNHVVQLIALLGMDITDLHAQEDAAEAKRVVTESLHVATENAKVIIGQYEGYTKEKYVNSDSSTPTFVQVTLTSSTGPLQHVPIHVKTGKALATKQGFIRINYKAMHQDIGSQVKANHLVFHIQPDVKIEACINTRSNDLSEDVNQFRSLLCNALSHTKEPRDAYERLIYEAILGRRIFFAHKDEILEGWRLVTEIEDTLHKQKGALHIYPKNTPFDQIESNTTTR